MLNVNLQLIVIFEIYTEREREGERDRQTDRKKTTVQDGREERGLHLIK